jgi:hypothetical protein
MKELSIERMKELKNKRKGDESGCAEFKLQFLYSFVLYITLVFHPYLFFHFFIL